MKIKILDNYKLVSERVETNVGDYTRYSPDFWYKITGRGEEPVSDNSEELQELEDAYQKFI